MNNKNKTSILVIISLFLNVILIIMTIYLLAKTEQNELNIETLHKAQARDAVWQTSLENKLNLCPQSDGTLKENCQK